MIKDYINRERLTETFIELIKINSPSFEEGEIGSVLSKKLASLGCRIEIQKYDRSFNLIAYKKGNNQMAPPILLSGHMDTIEPTTGISFSIENDVIRTTGNTVLGADDKSALAQIIEALTVIEEKKIPHGDIEIVFSSAEEKGLVGAKYLDFSRLRSKFALVLDSGGSVGRLVTAAPTHVTYEMHITGRSAHAGIEPEKGISAIRVASRIISEVPDGRIDPETTANIGIIRGGTATNVVPKEVIINGELRSHNTGVLEENKKRIFDTARMIAEKAGASINISEQEEYNAFRIERDQPFMNFLDSVFRKSGLTPDYTITGGGSDANIFNHNGIKAVNISTGMQNVHSTDEFIHINDLYNGSLVVLNAIMDFKHV